MLDIKKNENKSERLAIRVSKDEKDMLEKLSRHYESTMSEIVISMIKYHYEKIKTKY